MVLRQCVLHVSCRVQDHIGTIIPTVSGGVRTNQGQGEGGGVCGAGLSRTAG